MVWVDGVGEEGRVELGVQLHQEDGGLITGKIRYRQGEFRSSVLENV